MQTPSTALRHPPWSKGAGKRGMRVCSLCKLQALLYDILLGVRVAGKRGMRVCSLCKLQALLYDILLGGNVPESEAWIVKCALSLS